MINLQWFIIQYLHHYNQFVQSQNLFETTYRQHINFLPSFLLVSFESISSTLHERFPFQGDRSPKNVKIVKRFLQLQFHVTILPSFLLASFGSNRWRFSIPKSVIIIDIQNWTTDYNGGSRNTRGVRDR